MSEVKIDVKRAVFGGSLATLLLLVGGWWVGSAGNYETYQLFKAIVPATLSFYATIMMTLATVLALMLTLLGLSASLNLNIKAVHYHRIKTISTIITASLIVAVFAYLLLNIPIIETDQKALTSYNFLYYSTLAVSSFLGGAFIAIILLLYNTIRDMINIFRPDSTNIIHQEGE